MYYQGCKLSNSLMSRSSYQVECFSSDAYIDECKARNEKPNEVEKLRICKEKGFRVYKKFYAPRVNWFAQQREYLKRLRSDELYFSSILKILRRKSFEKSTNIFVRDSLPQINTQEFMQNIALLPFENQSTQMAGDDLAGSNSLTDLIAILS